MRGYFVFVDEVVSGGFDGVSDVESLGNAFDKMSFAGAKITLESDDERVGFEKR